MWRNSLTGQPVTDTIDAESAQNHMRGILALTNNAVLEHDAHVTASKHLEDWSAHAALDGDS